MTATGIVPVSVTHRDRVFPGLKPIQRRRLVRQINAVKDEVHPLQCLTNTLQSVSLIDTRYRRSDPPTNRINAVKLVQTNATWQMSLLRLLQAVV